MSGKYALIIGNTEYADPGLAQLTAPGKDAEDFARVLRDKEIGSFDEVNVLVNEPSVSVIESIDQFFDQKKPDDMLVLYFSGHGIKDEMGSLYLAFKNTMRSRLRSTAIKSDYIKEAMDQSRSRRQVLILDCCNSGAFPQGTKAELGGAMGMTMAFQGYGRFVLTASDATQFAWEGDKVIGNTDNSLFTHFLIKGLEGEADSDGDGRITVDELYDYAYEQVSRVTPKQTPSKSSSKQEGEIVLRQITRLEDIKPVQLPSELLDEIEDTRPYVREAAVQKLEKILKGRNIGLARSASEALEKIIADENTTRRVAQTAVQALATFRQLDQKSEAENQPILETEDKRSASDDFATQRQATEDENKSTPVQSRDIAETHDTTPLPKSEVELKTDEERLARQRAEAVRKAREREQLERRPPVLSPIPLEKGASGQQAQWSSTTKLSLGVMGTVFVFLLCLGGGWAAWPFIFPPATTESPTLPVSEIPPTIFITQTSAATSTVPPAEATLTFTPRPLPTATPLYPREPDQFLIFYFDLVITRQDHPTGWSLLTPEYQTKKAISWATYANFWGSVKSWKYSSIQVERNDNGRARVLITYTLFYNNNTDDQVNGARYCLLWEPNRENWQIDLRENCP